MPEGLLISDTAYPPSWVSPEVFRASHVCFNVSQLRQLHTRSEISDAKLRICPLDKVVQRMDCAQRVILWFEEHPPGSLHRAA